MQKELEDKLRNIQANPTTGTAHNAQVITTQVEEIFALDQLTGEVSDLKEKLGTYSRNSEKESKWMRFLSIGVAGVAILQLLIAYGQYKLGEVQIDWAHEQSAQQRGAALYQQLRDDRMEARDNQWRREDLEFQGRLPLK